MREIKQAIAAVRKAEEKALELIKAKMVAVARKHKIDKMTFCYVTTFYRKDKEVECAALEKLEKLFCDEIHPQGFEDIWEEGKGWL